MREGARERERERAREREGASQRERERERERESLLARIVYSRVHAPLFWFANSAFFLDKSSTLLLASASSLRSVSSSASLEPLVAAGGAAPLEAASSLSARSCSFFNLALSSAISACIFDTSPLPASDLAAAGGAPDLPWVLCSSTSVLGISPMTVIKVSPLWNQLSSFCLQAS